MTTLKNGDCRAKYLTESTGVQGFPTKSYALRTTDFLPCSWRSLSAKEKLAAGRVSAESVYEFIVPAFFNDSAVVIRESDRLEWKTVNHAGDEEIRELEIFSIERQQNVNLKILCLDRKDGEQ